MHSPFILSFFLATALLAGPAPGDEGAPGGAPSKVTTKAPRGSRVRGRTADAGRGDPAAQQSKFVNFINGGTNVPPGSYPFAVAIAYRNAGGGLSQYCGGALVMPNVVLTAAHCGVAPGDLAVIGREDLASSDGQAIPIVAVVAHEQFDQDRYRNDIALLRLGRSAPGQYRPIQWSTRVENLAGRPVTAIGWGKTSVDGPASLQLLETTVAVTSQEECAAKYSPGFQIDPGMVCASAPGKDACQGDSGGPLFSRPAGGGPPVQVGITSFGIGCADANFPGVYTRVAAHARWIQENLTR
jgi:secreted trypsin-like serine protease